MRVVAFTVGLAVALGASALAHFPLANLFDEAADSPAAVYVAVAAFELAVAGLALWGALAAGAPLRARPVERGALVALLVLVAFPWWAAAGGEFVLLNFALGAVLVLGAVGHVAVRR